MNAELPLLNSAEEGSWRNLTSIYFYSPSLIANKLKGGGDGSKRNKAPFHQCLALTWGHAGVSLTDLGGLIVPPLSRSSARLPTATGKSRMLREAGWLRCAFTPQLEARQCMTQQFHHKTPWIFPFCSAQTCKHSHEPRLTPQKLFLFHPTHLSSPGYQDNTAGSDVWSGNKCLQQAG